MAPDDAIDPLVAETLRLNRRYLDEVVVAFDLCPWADKSIRDGRVRRRVFVGEAPDPAAVLALIDELEASPSQDVEIGLAIFPLLSATPGAFDRFAEQVRQADRARRQPGSLPAFVLAAFHPDATPARGNPYQAVLALRRTPDPTLQLVRNALLESVRRSAPTVSDDVTTTNFERLMGPDGARVDAIIADIHADRARVHAALRSKAGAAR